MRYANRQAAGLALAGHLDHLAARSDVLVLGLPRGGVPVAAEVARRLDLDLDVIVVRKLGVPWHRELAMGAIAPGGVRVLQDRVIQRAGIRPYQVEEVAEREAVELLRQEGLYRAGRPPLELSGFTAVLVDDGLATGASMLAAVQSARELGAMHIVAAAPVGAPDTIRRVAEEADEVVTDQSPSDFTAVGQAYDDFGQVDDLEVLTALDQVAGRDR